MNYSKTLTAFVTMTIGGSSVVALLLTFPLCVVADCVRKCIKQLEAYKRGKSLELQTTPAITYSEC